jgi:formate dehydrogenase subunit delta
MSSREHLVYMANQIARNFATMGDIDAAKATADHVASFWDPRMKAALFADGTGLSRVAAAAFDRLRACGAPEPQTRATEFNTGGETGHSDAG